MNHTEAVEKAYLQAKERYAGLGVDTDKAIAGMDALHLSLHCWQSDDVGGFERPDAELGGGGIQVTGNYPGKARTLEQVRRDMETVMRLLPGRQRLNLHAIYGDFRGKKVERDAIDVEHFQSWIDWARGQGIGLDFNPTCFSHPYADDGFTLSSKNTAHRRFWIEHVKRSRRIAAAMGRQLGMPAGNNIWIPDGSKDIPVDRHAHRVLLRDALDEIFAEDFPRDVLTDTLESKLFGIGSESMVVGSHEFYLGYAVRHGKSLCIDTGHFHPTEQIGDKISSLLLFVDKVLLHVSRGVRWDSDHVVILNEELQFIAQEIIRCHALERINVGLDYFDGSINRIGAYVIGARATQQAFLFAMLEPTGALKTHEESGRNFERLALLEILKTMPFGAVYDFYCLSHHVPVGEEYIREIQRYEKTELGPRGRGS